MIGVIVSIFLLFSGGRAVESGSGIVRERLNRSHVPVKIIKKKTFKSGIGGIRWIS